jgi:hypothetical protein
MEIVKKFVPDLYELGTRKLFQLAVLQLSNKNNMNWEYHGNISSIKNEKVHVLRLVVESMFTNHFV